MSHGDGIAASKRAAAAADKRQIHVGINAMLPKSLVLIM